MFCAKCGKELQDGDGFCYHCGAPVVDTDGKGKSSTWMEVNIRNNNKGKSARLYGIVFGVLAVIAVLSVIVIARKALSPALSQRDGESQYVSVSADNKIQKNKDISEPPVPLEEIVNADPSELKYQLYDVIFTDNPRYAAYGDDVSSLFERNHNFSKTMDVSELVEYIESNTSLLISWKDYNPDRLMLSGESKYIQGVDQNGDLVYGLWTYNDYQTTKPWSDCYAIEICHYNPVRETDGDYEFDSSSARKQEYISIFAGINTYQDIWTYNQVLEVLKKYNNLTIEERYDQDSDSIRVKVSVHLEKPMRYIAYNSFTKKDGEYQVTEYIYSLEFDSESGKLINISFYPEVPQEVFNY